ncbi:hypothetical protein LOK49_LG03G01693 [Camellia lanceoleosa]|uniref:Uncharacterized protein n=1 Tax=Camellia lanceoleosa TaxID=1840588 RepID=A0ACC0I5Z9_9ERIC|nr:hypothetical protein LOK49_LG03G01693 [Camellia lanceoleosa]
MLEKSYIIHVEKASLEKLKEEERIMMMDTSGMSPMQQEYYYQRQMEIIESRRKSNISDVANIAVKVAYLNATDTQEHVKELLSTETEAFVHQSLMDCSANYDDAIGNFEDSMAAFESKGYDHIQTLVAAAMVDPQTCEDYFNESPDHTSPLTSRNTILVKLCSNALAIVKLAAAEK